MEVMDSMGIRDNIGIMENIEEMEEKLGEILNIIQLFQDAVETGEEAVYIRRSVRTIGKMVKGVQGNDLPQLKGMVQEILKG